MTKRFSALQRWSALAVLSIALSFITYGATAAPFPAPPIPTSADSAKIDAALYGAVLDRVSAGEDYYAAAASEQRTRGYPLHPFVTVRPPYFTWMIVGIGGRNAAATTLRMLVTASAVLMAFRLFMTMKGRALKLAAPIAALSFLTVRNVPIFWFEVWVSALVLLSLACWSSKTWVLSAVCGLAAALLRELFAPYLLVMLFVAIIEKRRAEIVGWSAALILFAASLTVHAARVHAVTSVGDKQSPGWLRGGGWPYVVRVVHESSALILLPLWVVNILVPLAVLGLVSWKHPIADRASLYLIGFITAFMVIGRQNNAYWGMLLTSLLLIGLAFAPGAIATLVQRARTRS